MRTDVFLADEDLGVRPRRHPRPSFPRLLLRLGLRVSAAGRVSKAVAGPRSPLMKMVEMERDGDKSERERENGNGLIGFPPGGGGGSQGLDRGFL